MIVCAVSLAVVAGPLLWLADSQASQGVPLAPTRAAGGGEFTSNWIGVAQVTVRWSNGTPSTEVQLGLVTGPSGSARSASAPAARPAVEIYMCNNLTLLLVRGLGPQGSLSARLPSGETFCVSPLTELQPGWAINVSEYDPVTWQGLSGAASAATSAGLLVAAYRSSPQTSSFSPPPAREG